MDTPLEFRKDSTKKNAHIPSPNKSIYSNGAGRSRNSQQERHKSVTIQPIFEIEQEPEIKRTATMGIIQLDLVKSMIQPSNKKPILQKKKSQLGDSQVAKVTQEQREEVNST